MAITGGLILLKPNLNATLGSKYLMTSSQCPFPAGMGAIASRAVILHPSSPIESIWIKAAPSASIIVRYTDQMHGYFDPCTGHAIGIEPRRSNLFGFAEYLHRFSYFDTPVAKWIGGILAAAMAVALVGFGLVAWWPRRSISWRSSFAAWSHPSRHARSRGRHALVGFVLSPLLLASTLSGTILALESGKSLPRGAMHSNHALAPAAADDARARLDVLDEALDNARARVESRPSLTTIVLGMGEEPLQVQMVEPRYRNPKGLSIAYASPASGAVLRYVPYEHAPPADRLRWWLTSLHVGLVGGGFWRTLMLLAMAGVVYLFCTGVKTFLMRLRYRERPGADAIESRVVAIREIARHVKCFELSPGRSARMPPIEPGAHVDIRLENGTTRQYSLCNGPGDRQRFIIAVKRLEEGRGGSAAMHGLRLGDVVHVGRPRNRFPLASTEHPVRLIAAGIGITPLFSMAQHLAREGMPFDLHYYGRTLEDMAFIDELRALLHPECLTLHVGLSRSSISASLLSSMQDFTGNGHVYACGPAGFLAMATSAAASTSIPEGRFHLERFDAGNTAPRENLPFDVLLSGSGTRLTVSPDESLLSALRRSGIRVDSACEEGLCGTCSLRVLSGELEHRDHVLTPQERQAGHSIISCISRCRGTLVLDA